MLHLLLCWCIKGESLRFTFFFWVPPFSCSESLRLPDHLTQQLYNSFTQFKETAALQTQWIPPDANLSQPVELAVYFNSEIIVKYTYNMGHFEFYSIQFTCWIIETEYILCNTIFKRSLLKLSSKSIWSSLLSLFPQNNYEALNSNRARQLTLS